MILVNSQVRTMVNPGFLKYVGPGGGGELEALSKTLTIFPKHSNAIISILSTFEICLVSGGSSKKI